MFFSYRALNYMLISTLGSLQTTQNFVGVIVFFAKKICQQEATSSANNFFHLPKSRRVLSTLAFGLGT